MGGAITIGARLVLGKTPTARLSVAMLSATGTLGKAVVCWRSQDNVNPALVRGFCTLLFVTLPGTTITKGTDLEVSATPTYHIDITALSDTKAAVCYRGPGNAGDFVGTSATCNGLTVNVA